MVMFTFRYTLDRALSSTLQGQLALGYLVGLKDLSALIQKILLYKEAPGKQGYRWSQIPFRIHQFANASAGMVQGIVANGPDLA